MSLLLMMRHDEPEYKTIDDHPYCDSCAKEIDAVIAVAERDAGAIFGGKSSTVPPTKPSGTGTTKK